MLYSTVVTFLTCSEVEIHVAKFIASFGLTIFVRYTSHGGKVDWKKKIASLDTRQNISTEI